MSDFLEILDETVTHLNSFSFSKSFTATRTYTPRNTLEELEGLQVAVFPISTTDERENRSTNRIEYSIGIVVTQNVDPTDDTDISDLMTLCREITNSFFDEIYPDNLLNIVGANNEPIFDHEKLSQNNVFQSIINITGYAYTWCYL